MATQEQLEEQPFYVVPDDAWFRMMDKLKKGKPYVKTYIGTCPHKNKKKCKCRFNKNILKGNKIIRMVNGVEKNVYPICFVIKFKDVLNAKYYGEDDDGIILTLPR